MAVTSRLSKLAGAFSVMKLYQRQSWSIPGGLAPSRLSHERQNFSHTVSNVAFDPCWQCGISERRSNFFCKNCNALQKPASHYNLFHLLGVDETFEIDSNELSKNFRQLQALLHPDKFSNATEDEQRYSADLSSHLNKAFSTLSDPLKRGLYLLNLQGLALQEENTSQDKAFLLEIMELNEELESISSVDELHDFQSRNKKALESIIRRLSKSFASQDTVSARAALMEMKYFITLEDKIKEKMMTLGAL